MNQKEGVFLISLTVMGENGIEFEEGMKVTDHVTDVMRKKIVLMTAQDLLDGKIELSTEARAKYDTLDKMKTYANGLVNNWFRKDTRLNGGAKYEAKNPGSRQGIGDSQLKNLKALFELKKGDPVAAAAISQAIENRKHELAEEKAKKVVVDVDKIPAELRAKLGI